jgi:hypothetical protein
MMGEDFLSDSEPCSHHISLISAIFKSSWFLVLSDLILAMFLFCLFVITCETQVPCRKPWRAEAHRCGVSYPSPQVLKVAEGSQWDGISFLKSRLPCRGLQATGRQTAAHQELWGLRSPISISLDEPRVIIALSVPTENWQPDSRNLNIIQAIMVSRVQSKTGVISFIPLWLKPDSSTPWSNAVNFINHLKVLNFVLLFPWNGIKINMSKLITLDQCPGMISTCTMRNIKAESLMRLRRSILFSLRLLIGQITISLTSSSLSRNSC